MKKRTFLKSMAALTAIPSFFKELERWNIVLEGQSAEEVAQNEEYWAVVRSGYRLKPDYINLENGYYCFVPLRL